MKAQHSMLALGLLILFCTNTMAEEGLIELTGQTSAWVNYSDKTDLPIWLGARYLPQLNGRQQRNRKLTDFELSTDLSGSAGVAPFDSTSSSLNIKPYRLWARYSAPQFEIRLGLQKINFGSATLLRLIRWIRAIRCN